jgi:apolipoprotein N-acyltransferase
MRWVGFILMVALGLTLFGLHILWCFMGLLVVGLGVDVEAAMTIGLVLTVALVAGIGFKSFFIDK